MKMALQISITVLFTFYNSSLFAQLENKLNPTLQSETIARLTLMLNDYVHPDKGKIIAEGITNNLNDGKYDKLEDFREFASAVNNDLFEMSNDKHLIIYYAPEDVADIKMGAKIPEEKKSEDETRKKIISSKDNFGFAEVKILPGNTGYIKLNEFEKANYSKETAHAAMAFVAYTDALIIDLRNNSGGWNSLVQILLSYFFDYEDLTNNIILFETLTTYLNEVTQYRVLPDLPGKRLLNIPIYVLTSERTYSAAEKFTDVMQKRKRATIIGETTKGGANFTRGPEVLNYYYIVKMPVGRTINPVTGTNWEGTGIEPDIKVDRKNALDTAMDIIIKNLIEQNSDERFINRLGYSLVSEGKLDLAIDIFKENVRMYPESANVYDSLGEVLLLNGEKEEALKNYKKSLELNPGNNNAKKTIEKLIGVEKQ